MGLRFRKSVKICKGVRVNFGKFGASLSVGTKGARYTMHTSGRRTATVGIPGTGLSYTKSSGGGKRKNTTRQQQARNQAASTQNGQIEQTKNKVSLWKIILGIIFFPIALTIIIAKSKKMKPILKIVLIAILWIFVLVVGVSNSNEATPSNDSSISDGTHEEQVDDTAPTTNGNEQLTPPEAEEIGGQDKESTVGTKYHSNEQINKLLIAYNAIAEYPIAPEMVQNGAYAHKANISYSGVWISIYATSDNGMFVDFDGEAPNDGVIQSLFRDFCKALNSKISDDDIKSAWTALQTGEYKNYRYYDCEGIECTYSQSTLSNGEYRYLVKTNYKAYH